MAKKGRPRKSGARNAAGRLAQMRDHGNDRAQSRAAAFRLLCGDSAIGHEMTCAGRLMLVGAFDGLEQAPEIYLSALLEYSNGYWGYLGGGARIAQHERFSRAYENGTEFTPDLRGEWFENFDKRLRDAGHSVRMAVHQATVDRHWFPDDDVGWVARIINSRFAARKLPVAGEIACDSDWAMLELLQAGASALVGQALRRAA